MKRKREWGEEVVGWSSGRVVGCGGDEWGRGKEADAKGFQAGAEQGWTTTRRGGDGLGDRECERSGSAEADEHVGALGGAADLDSGGGGAYCPLLAGETSGLRGVAQLG